MLSEHLSPFSLENLCVEKRAKERRQLSDGEGILGKGSMKICDYLQHCCLR